MIPRRPRDPAGRRQAIIDAAVVVIAQHGLAGLTHRRVAQVADVPVGSTTYYFKDLDELTHDALAHAAAETIEGLESWRHELEQSPDLADTLARLSAEYLAERQQYRTLNELHAAAMYQPGLRTLANQWSEGLVELLQTHLSREAALTTAMFLDGVILRGLISDHAPEHALITAAIRRLISK